MMRKKCYHTTHLGLQCLSKWFEIKTTLHGKYMGKQWKQGQTLFFEALKSLQMVIAAMKLKDVYSLEGKF